jgi:hypothetical protein
LVFKTEKGGYSEGDNFLGVRVPQIRKIINAHLNEVGLKEAVQLLKSPWHKVRLSGYTLLVDISAREIIGNHLIGKDKNILRVLSKSKSLWERRIAIISTWAFIKNGDPKETFSICETPRVMLRYALEKHGESQRKKYMNLPPKKKLKFSDYFSK